MKLVYIGPHPSVDIEHEGVVIAEDVHRDGDPVDVPDNVAANLLAQGTYRDASAVPAGPVTPAQPPNPPPAQPQPATQTAADSSVLPTTTGD